MIVHSVLYTFLFIEQFVPVCSSACCLFLYIVHGLLDAGNVCYFTYLTCFGCCCWLQDLLECTLRATFWRQQKVGALSSTKLLQFVCLVILFFCAWVLVDESSSDPFARPSVM